MTTRHRATVSYEFDFLAVSAAQARDTAASIVRSVRAAIERNVTAAEQRTRITGIDISTPSAGGAGQEPAVVPAARSADALPVGAGTQPAEQVELCPTVGMVGKVRSHCAGKAGHGGLCMALVPLRRTASELAAS